MLGEEGRWRELETWGPSSIPESAAHRLTVCLGNFSLPLPMGFPRQEYWRGLSFPSPGDLFDPGIESASLMSPALAGGFFTTAAI